jgi:hypothetical protein
MVVGASGNSNVEVQLISNADVQAVIGGLHPPLALDAAKGSVVVQMHNSSGSIMAPVPGFSATISASHGSTFDPNTQMYATTTTVSPNKSGVLVFPNAATGTTSVTVSPPTGHSCTPRQPISSQRIDAGVFTFADYDCT